jgi:hypothetical protein
MPRTFVTLPRRPPLAELPEPGEVLEPEFDVVIPSESAAPPTTVPTTGRDLTVLPRLVLWTTCLTGVRTGAATEATVPTTSSAVLVTGVRT